MTGHAFTQANISATVNADGHQLQRALSELSYAIDRTPMYRRHLERNGLSLDEIRTADDFASIPVTSKEDFRLGFPLDVLASGFTIDADALMQTQSSGTGGDRLTTLELETIYSARALRCAAVNPALYGAMLAAPRRHVRLAAPHCASIGCAIPVAPASDRASINGGTLILEVESDLLTTGVETWISAIEQIERLRPQLYYADPAHLSELALQARALGCDLYPAPVLLNYSLPLAIYRRHIRDVFAEPAPAMSAVVSMSELGWLAAECPEGNLHFNDTSFYGEFRRNGRMARNGELAELVVTTLDHGCTPRIRYRTGDIFTATDGPCPCGCAAPVIRMEGRLQDCVVQEGEVVLTPRGVDEIVGDPVWLERYRLQQLEEKTLRLLFIAHGDFAGDVEAIADRLRAHLVAGSELMVEQVEHIASALSGKFSACMSDHARRRVTEGWTL